MVTFDTNVLLYSADGRDPRKQDIAIQVIRGSTDAVLLWQACCEFISVSRKLAAYGLTAHEAWELLAEYLGTFRLALPSAAVLKRARTLHTQQQCSFWDALLIGACLEAGVTRLYTEDLPGRPAPKPLEIVNPFAT